MEEEFINDNVKKLNNQVEKLREAHLYTYANEHQSELDKILSGVILLEKEKSFSLDKVFMRDAIVKQIIALESKFATEYVPKIEEINKKYSDLKLDKNIEKIKDELEIDSTAKSFEKLNEIYNEWMSSAHTPTEKQIAGEKVAALTYDILIDGIKTEGIVDLRNIKDKELLVKIIKQEIYKKAEECNKKNDSDGDIHYNELAQEVSVDNLNDSELWEKLTNKSNLKILEEIKDETSTDLVVSKDNKFIRFFKRIWMKINPKYKVKQNYNNEIEKTLKNEEKKEK